mmetsp:Transcript_11845/g.22553  ORF Transcript_11845/g.22553 Transcript_11845/m.22553 type:complete len:107 (+) Transcript_11845:917-1237(+)
MRDSGRESPLGLGTMRVPNGKPSSSIGQVAQCSTEVGTYSIRNIYNIHNIRSINTNNSTNTNTNRNLRGEGVPRADGRFLLSPMGPWHLKCRDPVQLALPPCRLPP